MCFHQVLQNRTRIVMMRVFNARSIFAALDLPGLGPKDTGQEKHGQFQIDMIVNCV